MASIDDLLKKISEVDAGEEPADEALDIDSILNKVDLEEAEIEGKPAPVSKGDSGAESFTRGVGQGLTLNFQDEISAGIEAGIIDPIASAFTGESAFRPGSSFSEKYSKALEGQRAEIEEAKASNPKLFLTGEISGMVATTLIPAGGVAKAASAAGKGAKALSAGTKLGTSARFGRGVQSAAELAGKTAVRTAEGAAYGGLSRAGSADENKLSEGLEGAETGAAFSAALNLLPGAIKQTAKGSKYLTRKAFQGIRGISDETIDILADNPKALKVIESKGDNAVQAVTNFSVEVAEDLTTKRNAYVNAINDEIDDIVGRGGKESSKRIPIRSVIRSFDKEIQKNMPAVTDEAKNLVRELADQRERLVQTFLKNNLSDDAQSSIARIGRQREILLAEKESLLSKISLNQGSATAAPKAAQSFSQRVSEIDDKLIPELEKQIKNAQAVGQAKAIENIAVDPRTFNRLRQSFDNKAREFYNADAGKATNLSKAYKTVSDEARSEMNRQIPKVSNLNNKLSKLFQTEEALGKFGVNKKIIPAEKLVNLLKGNEAGGKFQRWIDYLGSEVKMNIGKKAELTKAVKELNPENPINAFMTGRSNLAAALGFFLGGPSGAAIGFAAGAPIITKPLVRGATAISRGTERAFSSSTARRISDLSQEASGKIPALFNLEGNQ